MKHCYNSQVATGKPVAIEYTHLHITN